MITTVHLLHLITASTLRRCIKSMAMSIAGLIHCLLEYEKDAFPQQLAIITSQEKKGRTFITHVEFKIQIPMDMVKVYVHTCC